MHYSVLILMTTFSLFLPLYVIQRYRKSAAAEHWKHGVTVLPVTAASEYNIIHKFPTFDL